jgi:F0F1-type ATP synthase assembly protein I
MAMELPIIFVAAVVIGGGLGYFIDHWLHTRFIFMFVFGGLGFFAGLREILRRLPG